MTSSPDLTGGARPAPARERLLAAASALFYAEGITATGVDRVAAAAGVTKATLYNNFRSKEELVAACLRGQLDAWAAATAVADRPAARAPQRVSILFEVLAADALSADYRGCPFTNAAVEMRQSELVMAVVHEYRRRIRAHVGELVGDPHSPAVDAILYLYDGAIAAVKTTGDPSHVLRARDAALHALPTYVTSVTGPTPVSD